MESFEKTVEIRWSDLDPNFHVLHSRYYDFGAYCRMAYFVEMGITPQVMFENKIGPILFREECLFKKEIKFGDLIKIDIKVVSNTPDYSRWSMTHQLWKHDMLAAIINVDGAWLNTLQRKLAVPPLIFHPVFENAPRV
ncbi:MAG: thioesterase family protein [Ferruginibacter sp.]